MAKKTIKDKAHKKESIICITTPNQALAKLHTKVQDYIDTIGKNFSLVDELIKLRRADG
ncbi:hypothetical protein [Rickettsia australis]|uniref:Uncharacterized protein n=1 Tax=Rickettsia australis (strain Cutlack) TaxID=1105110 RepID=H8K9J4_RICAC|nr:hypothetical protein [Rickettsia australis]AFC70714.1 hypothetical protein MC5_01600 [Rickettsia australis str. Cutlack]